MPMEPSFDPRTAKMMELASQELGLNVRIGGTVVTIEGPRFSSIAESRMFQQWGGHLVNMTTCPEVTLAKEAGLLYSSIAMATDFDCWNQYEDNVCAADVISIFMKNVNKISCLLVKTIELIGNENWDHDIDQLKVISN